MHVPPARTYAFPSASMCGLFGEISGLTFLQEECLLKVFTADGYFVRRVCSRKLKCSTGKGRDIWFHSELLLMYFELNYV